MLLNKRIWGSNNLREEKFVFMPGVFLLLFLTDAKADICYEVNDQTAAKAITVIEKQKEIYKYCSLCENAESQHIWVENTGYDTAVYVNG